MSVNVDVTLSRCGFCVQIAWFADRSSFFRRIRFPAMIAVIRHPSVGMILFDAGYGRTLQVSQSGPARIYRRLMPFQLPEEDRIPARLRQLNVPQVALIFLSHLHPDHIGGLREVPGSAPILYSREGLSRLQSMRGMKRHRSLFFDELLPDDFQPRARAIEDLPAAPLGEPFGEGRDITGDGAVVAIPLPGHAVGQYGLLCRLSGQRRILLCADAAWLRSNVVRQPRPTWAARLIADDSAALTRTLIQLFDISLHDPNVEIIPSHCEKSM